MGCFLFEGGGNGGAGKTWESYLTLPYLPSVSVSVSVSKIHARAGAQG